MVFGFLKQSGGHISVYSEPGIGTTFRMLLPRCMAEAERYSKDAIETAELPIGTERVLLVDDNEALR